MHEREETLVALLTFACRLRHATACPHTLLVARGLPNLQAPQLCQNPVHDELHQAQALMQVLRPCREPVMGTANNAQEGWKCSVLVDGKRLTACTKTADAPSGSITG